MQIKQFLPHATQFGTQIYFQKLAYRDQAHMKNYFLLTAFGDNVLLSPS